MVVDVSRYGRGKDTSNTGTGHFTTHLPYLNRVTFLSYFRRFEGNSCSTVVVSTIDVVILNMLKKEQTFFDIWTRPSTGSRYQRSETMHNLSRF